MKVFLRYMAIAMTAPQPIASEEALKGTIALQDKQGQLVINAFKQLHKSGSLEMRLGAP
jgi:hypothetical protein